MFCDFGVFIFIEWTYLLFFCTLPYLWSDSQFFFCIRSQFLPIFYEFHRSIAQYCSGWSSVGDFNRGPVDGCFWANRAGKKVKKGGSLVCWFNSDIISGLSCFGSVEFTDVWESTEVHCFKESMNSFVLVWKITIPLWMLAQILFDLFLLKVSSFLSSVSVIHFSFSIASLLAYQFYSSFQSHFD